MQTSGFSPFVCAASSGADCQWATIRSMESAKILTGRIHIPNSKFHSLNGLC